MIDQPMPVHGYQTIEWDHASLPEWFWRQVTRQPNGCWTAEWQVATGLRDSAITRLLKVNAREAWAVTPTCGNHACVNPAHTCVTMATPASIRERRKGQK